MQTSKTQPSSSASKVRAVKSRIINSAASQPSVTETAREQHEALERLLVGSQDPDFDPIADAQFSQLLSNDLDAPSTPGSNNFFSLDDFNEWTRDNASSEPMAELEDMRELTEELPEEPEEPEEPADPEEPEDDRRRHVPMSIEEQSMADDVQPRVAAIVPRKPVRTIKL